MTKKKIVKKKNATKKNIDIKKPEPTKEPEIKEKIKTDKSAIANNPPKVSRPNLKTFDNWSRLKHNEDIAVGCKIRLRIDGSERMKESEFDNYINKFLKS